MSDPIASMINLINNMNNTAQLDDTDPNNVVVQCFLSPTDTLSYIEENFTQQWVPPVPADNSITTELVTALVWGTAFIWAGDGSANTFMWCQGGLYS
jgi:hypothetical protein